MIQKTLTRDSNMELYRIMAMVFVMLFHAFGELDKNTDTGMVTIENSVILWFTGATYVCVDMFILLSGWYGIHARRSKLQAFIFQVLFYSFIVYAVTYVLFDDVEVTPGIFIRILTTDIYWFIPVYLMLYLCSGALNPFIRQASQHEYVMVLGSVFAMQCVFGWLNKHEAGYLSGCSPISFLILYLIGGYLRRFPNWLKNLSRKSLILLYLLLITAHWLLALFAKSSNSDYLIDMTWKYASPFIIIASCCLLLLFSKINIGYSKTINWVAASSFAVFLIHCFPFFYNNVFRPTVRGLYNALPVCFAIPTIMLFLIVLFLGSILADQFRIWMYRQIARH